MGTLDQKFATLDRQMELGLEKVSDIVHHQTRGNEYEKEVHEVLSSLLPSSRFFQVSAGELATEKDSPLRKQVDLVVHPPIPQLLRRESGTRFLPEWILIAGEVKSTLSYGDRGGIVETADRIARFAEADYENRLPFLVVGGATQVSRNGIATLAADLANRPASPAIFCFDPGQGSAGFAGASFWVSHDSPVTAIDADGNYIDGTVTLDADSGALTALMFMWTWASLQYRAIAPAMNYSGMSAALAELTQSDPILAHTVDASGAHREQYITLGLTQRKPAVSWQTYTETLPERRHPAPAFDGAARKAAEAVAHEQASNNIADSGYPDKVMLITLGHWVDQEDTWDESPWGGQIESRRGYGYYPDMSADDLLQAARVFWKFNPNSPTWHGVEYAVVAHAGETRAVLRIDRFIGPMWNRWGFQGTVVTDPAIVDALVGKPAPTRQNPITTWIPSTTDQ
ncbi:hypothetical protein FEK35_27105 [Nocardia cyriacigeorgica]|uniref:DUF6602 domain-containing protein n=1 Tax=Nocardia cyriacigeorgica TaxID=135487 RepID=A0A5R8P8T5_9NOCA|nr:DUF6602 domain-containing protein [Nocardia cyriacigeorgica]TLF97576.1 hypothetical protein FEK35_27105 [Nocardia cyriacigeorgica]